MSISKSLLSLKEAWRLLGSLYNWKEPSEFDGLLEADFSERNEWRWARHRIATDQALIKLMLVQAVVYVLTFACLFLDVARQVKGLDLLIWPFVLSSLLLQGVWAAVSVRSHRMSFAEQDAGLVRKFLRTWLLLCPFAVIPAWLVATIFHPLMPVRIYIYERSYPNVLVLGRFWHYAFGLLGAGNGSLSERVLDVARLSVYRRSDLFDVASENDIGRYTIPAGVSVLSLIVGVAGMTMASNSDSAFALGVSFWLVFAGIAFGVMSYITSSIGMAWFPMLLRKHQEDPELHREDELKEASWANRLFVLHFMTVPVSIFIAAMLLK